MMTHTWVRTEDLVALRAAVHGISSAIGTRCGDDFGSTLEVLNRIDDEQVRCQEILSKILGAYCQRT